MEDIVDDDAEFLEEGVLLVLDEPVEEVLEGDAVDQLGNKQVNPLEEKHVHLHVLGRVPLFEQLVCPPLEQRAQNIIPELLFFNNASLFRTLLANCCHVLQD